MTRNDQRLCTKFSSAELEKTFFYPGPHFVRLKPGAPAVRAWEQAKEVCIECPVFLACRENCWGEEFGVIGGTDQYERYLHRRKMQRRYAAMEPEEQEALRARLHSRSGSKTLEYLSGQTGLSVGLVRTLINEHQQMLDDRRKAAQAAAMAAYEKRPESAPEWPKGRPEFGDGWLWRNEQVYAGHYVAETPGGAWIRMKFRVRKTPVIRWFEAEHVDLRVRPAPVYVDFAGRNPSAQKGDRGEPAAA